ncbi:MAG: carboxypeptidase regulatory-like domain-containing protein [Eubacterium sp.]|nr:carboxypeptidase regulatory-like domain-containing protein [Eubacterium sp.]
MKSIKKTLSMVLVFALIFTSFSFVPKTAGAAEDFYSHCKFVVAAPYEEYFGGVSYSYLDENDLKDDFGIGLPTDGSDAENGKHFTAIRALANIIRRYIMEEYYVTENQANAHMKNYISYENGMIKGLSNDGIHWNTGFYQNPNVEASTEYPTGDGYWSFCGDKSYSNSLIGSTYLSEANEEYEFELKFISYTGDYGEILQDDYGFVKEGKSLTGTVNAKKFSDELDKPQYVPVTDATVAVYNSNDNDDKLITTVKTDENGKYTIPNLKGGKYKLVASKEVQSKSGQVYSSLTYTNEFGYVIKKPATPKKVKVKGGKKKITVSWEYSYEGEQYQVYISKKKNGKNKQACDFDVQFGFEVKIKKSKGTYYVKVRDSHWYNVAGGVDGIYKGFYSSFSKPIKVKVK